MEENNRRMTGGTDGNQQKNDRKKCKQMDQGINPWSTRETEDDNNFSECVSVPHRPECLTRMGERRPMRRCVSTTTASNRFQSDSRRDQTFLRINKTQSKRNTFSSPSRFSTSHLE